LRSCETTFLAIGPRVGLEPEVKALSSWEAHAITTRLGLILESIDALRSSEDLDRYLDRVLIAATLSELGLPE
jgi:hypothetical protein